MATADEMKAIARMEFEEVFSKGRIELLDEILGDEYVCYDPALPEPVRGREGLRAAVLGFRTAMPDLRFTVDQQVAETAVVEDRADRGQRDGRHGGHAQRGHHRGQGQRELGPPQQRAPVIAHPSCRLEHRTGH